MSPHAVLRCCSFALASVAACGCAVTDDTIGHVERVGDGECVADVPLKRRPEGAAVALVEGVYEGTDPASWPLVRREHFVTLQGQGYLMFRWQIEYASKAGVITPPLVTVTSGTFLHVGGGGGNNLGDAKPGTSGTFMGNAEEGLSTMPAGVPTPWLSEFYYLDGEVTIHQNETDGLYNVIVSPKTYEEVITPGSGVVDPGVVCDPE